MKKSLSSARCKDKHETTRSRRDYVGFHRKSIQIYDFVKFMYFVRFIYINISKKLTISCRTTHLDWNTSTNPNLCILSCTRYLECWRGRKKLGRIKNTFVVWRYMMLRDIMQIQLYMIMFQCSMNGLALEDTTNMFSHCLLILCMILHLVYTRGLLVHHPCWRRWSDWWWW